MLGVWLAMLLARNLSFKRVIRGIVLLPFVIPTGPRRWRGFISKPLAGQIVAGPNILTTNEWNVVALDRFEALGLVPFNINPRYEESDPALAPTARHWR